MLLGFSFSFASGPKKEQEGEFSQLGPLGNVNSNYRVQMKKALRETQALCAGGSKVEPKIFAPVQTHFPGGCRTAKI